MAKRKFNPLAAYGTIAPPYNGAVHQQDGGYFSPSGELLWEDHPATPPKVVKTEETTVDTATGETITKEVETEVEQIEEGDARTILTAWLKGEAELAHGTVRGQVKKGYGKVLATKAEIVDFLVNDANLVPAELVRIKV